MAFVNEQIEQLARDQQAKRDLVEDLLAGNLHPAQQRRAAAFGIVTGSPVLVVVGRVGESGAPVDSESRHRAGLILAANLRPGAPARDATAATSGASRRTTASGRAV